jgi:hypothetical protein
MKLMQQDSRERRDNDGGGKENHKTCNKCDFLNPVPRMVFPSFIMHLMGRARAKDRKGEKKTNEAQYGEHGKGMRERTRKKKKTREK